MKTFITLFITFLICFIFNHSGYSKTQRKEFNTTFSINKNKTDHNRISNSNGTDSVEVTIIYIKGKIPVKAGQPDTLFIRLRKNVAGLFPVKINIRIDRRNDPVTLFDTAYTITQSNTFDTLLRHALPKFTSVQYDLVIVEALPGKVASRGQDNFFDSKQYCRDITYDTYNYADPCLNDDGGVGFSGQSGNIVAALYNNDTASYMISAVDHCFFDTAGGGNHPYKIVIYSDDGNGKPGSPLYISPLLSTPPGTGGAVRVIHNISPQINIPPGNRFYVGYKQTTPANISASFQNEIPVRANSFFYTTPENNNFWIDFSDSLADFRLDISVIGSSGILRLSFIPETFYDAFNNKLKMSDSLRVYLRQTIPPYNIVDSTIGKIDSVTLSKNFSINNAPDANYYISVKHRNSVEIWTKTFFNYIDSAVSFYDFTSAATQAYGDNLIKVDSIPFKFASYSGEVTNDGAIDLSDNIKIYNDASIFTAGYAVSDVNADYSVDLTDLLICYNNSVKFITKIIPP